MHADEGLGLLALPQFQRRLRGVRRRSADIGEDRFDLAAKNAAGGVDFVHGHLRAVLRGRAEQSGRARQRDQDADLDRACGKGRGEGIARKCAGEGHAER
jgi:hypothetical protein